MDQPPEGRGTVTTPAPAVTDHEDFERRLLELRQREKAHTREGDAIALVEPDQVGLQVLPVQPPPRPGMVPARGQAARSTGGTASGMPPLPHPCHRLQSVKRAGDRLLGSRPRSGRRSGTGRDPKHDLAGTDSTWRDLCCGVI